MKRFALVVTALLAAEGVARADHMQKYFPLQDGNKWSYVNLNYGSLGGFGVVQSWYGITRVDALPGAGEVWLGWSGNTLYMWDAEAGAWKTFLRFGATTGTTYTINIGGTMYANVEVTVASKSATVTDKQIKQTFYNCVRFTLSPPPGWADAGIGELVFAPNVGLLTWSEQSIAGPVSHMLTFAYANGKKIGEIGFDHLEGGPHTQYPMTGTNQVLLINTQAQWESFYAQHSPGTPAPAVNFAKNSVIAVLAGTRNTGGYSVKTQLLRWNFPYSGAKIFVQENKPGPGVIVTMALTKPYQILVTHEKAWSISKVWEVVEYGPTE